MTLTENEVSKLDNAIETTRAHIERNKRRYLIGGAVAGVALVGVGGYILGARTKPKTVENIIAPKPSIKQAGLVWKSPPTIEITIEALGDPGNIVQDLTTGTIYASQGQAARALGVHSGTMANHLKGVTDSINGHKLVKLGKAHVPDVA